MNANALPQSPRCPWLFVSRVCTDPITSASVEFCCVPSRVVSSFPLPTSIPQIPALPFPCPCPHTIHPLQRGQVGSGGKAGRTEPSPLDEADELLLELALPARLLEIVDAAEVEHDVARLTEVDLGGRPSALAREEGAEQRRRGGRGRGRRRRRGREIGDPGKMVAKG